MFNPKEICNYAIQQTIGTFAVHWTLRHLFDNVVDHKDLLGLRSKDWKSIFDVKAMDAKNWNRFEPKAKSGQEWNGGKWLGFGTNMKSFDIISKSIFDDIDGKGKTNQPWRDLRIQPADRPKKKSRKSKR